ncbi:unnamed protein product [Blepharisma stoltei]|uniref:Uncharacterized protein n=1 Tax=Blepharisma stoltei TaxID=1481888 RepID=A0AAU9JYB6_9CILI|nr:unnamed protein product [Blepharisma stoltei]
MRTLICTFGGCQAKAIAKCSCKNPELLLCAGHLGVHVISPGKHSFENLPDDPYLQTKNDVLLYMQNEIQKLEDLKRNLSLEAYSAIIKLKSNLENYNDKIDLEIRRIVENMSEIMNTLESSNKNPSLDYLKLSSSEAIDYIQKNNQISILHTPYETIIPEIYKNLGWEKISEIQEISKKNKDLEIELLEVKTSMNQLFQKNIKETEELKQSYEALKAREIELIRTIEITEQKYIKENEELKQSYEALKTREIELIKKIEITEQKNMKENEELKQSYEALKAKEIELIKNIEVTEQSNKYLKDAYNEIYKKCQDLESRNSKPDDAQLQRAATMPAPAQKASSSSFFGKTISNSVRRRQ